MGDYRARDLLLWPNLVSLARLPLAVSFALLATDAVRAVSILLASAATDVLDGWLARRLGQATPTGAVVDAVADKAFAAVVIGTLLVDGRLSVPAALMLGARELGELPLVAWWSVHRARRRARAEDPAANWLGKVATVCQFVGVVAIIAQSPLAWPLLVVTACAGVVAAFSYWRRELRR
jgi:phosphatidylglycerophosphate synthase